MVHPVIPAQAGIQGFQSLALGPRFREGDGFGRQRNFFTSSEHSSEFDISQPAGGLVNPAARVCSANPPDVLR